MLLENFRACARLFFYGCFHFGKRHNARLQLCYKHIMTNAKVAKTSKRGAAKGERRGGRQKGTPNKKTQALQELIAEKYPGYNPVLEMVDMALDDETPKDLKFACNKEVAKYMVPQLKAIEMIHNEHTLPVININGVNI